MPQVLGTDPGAGCLGVGTTLQGATFGPMGMIVRVGLPGPQVNQDIDVTTMNVVEKWMAFIAGLKNAGEVNLDLVYHKTNQASVMTALGGANESWTITLPDGSTFVCSGYLKGVGATIPHDDKITQTVNLKLSGKPVFTAGSS